MKKNSIRTLSIGALLTHTCITLAAVNPVTVTYVGGTTDFSITTPGTANYAVMVNPHVTPSNIPLTYSLTSPGSSPGLTATQVTTGGIPSSCTNNGINTLCGNTFALTAGQSCCLAFSLTSSIAGSHTLQPTINTTPGTYPARAPQALPINVTPTSLTVTPSTLALSVNCQPSSGCSTTQNAALTGHPRTITIANNTSTSVTGLTIAYPMWTSTSVTSITTTCGTTLLGNASCTITVTPGETATSGANTQPCSTGTAPTPQTIAITSDNTPMASANVVVLNYGCIWQGGYVFAVDDAPATAPLTGSIGGTVLSTIDQASRYHSNAPGTGIIWSSNGVGGASANLSYDIIPGISLISTTSTPDPTYAIAQTGYNSTYSNEATYPFPMPSSVFKDCDGRTEGACNSDNILALYTAVKTNYDEGGSGPYTLEAGPTTPSYYAAGLCHALTSPKQDWYLPAICQMGPASNGSDCSGTQNIVTNLSILLSDPDHNPDTSCIIGSGCLADLYWSSTEDSASPMDVAWDQFFSSGTSSQEVDYKYLQLGVRCSRGFTP